MFNATLMRIMGTLTPQPRAVAVHGTPSAVDHRERVIGDMVAGFDRLAFRICDVAGDIDIVNERLGEQAEQLDRVSADAARMSEGNALIDSACKSTREVAAGAARDISESLPEASRAVQGIQSLVDAIHDFDRRFESLTSSLTSVSNATIKIGEITAQTKVLSVNAAIEAAEAGDLGVGFSVVAKEVKELAEATGEVTEMIVKTVTQLSDEVESLRRQSHANAQQASKAHQEAQKISSTFERLDDSVRAIGGEIESIATTADTNVEAGSETVSRISSLVSDVGQSSSALRRAAERTGELMTTSQRIIAQIAESGIRSEDTPVIEATLRSAALIAERFEQAVDRGEITEADLFDEDYQPIPGTNPQQWTTKFVKLADEVLPPVQEPQLEVDPRVLFSAAVDRNGYLPTNNRKLGHEQGPDPEWNDVHCRQRRFFAEEVTLAAARNTKPILLQTHRRIMEDGTMMLVKDLSVPIHVRGRHWGALRCGFHVAV